MIPLVVVIPTKNRRALLARALASVFMQDYPDYRIVVVNDGSTDGTGEYLDALKNERVGILTHSQSRGVNAARNAAFATLESGEWAVPLDDDDLLLPGALTRIATSLASMPEEIQIACFTTITRTGSGDHKTGRRFQPGEEWHDFTYYELFVDAGTDGDWRSAYRSSLFPTYNFQEDINGFEGEWWLLVGRDGIGVRAVPVETTLIDQSHEGEQLRLFAARRNPRAFVRAHLRIFRAHQEFLRNYPEVARERAISALKLSLRTLDPIMSVQFLRLYCDALVRGL